jgi:hypothetical protein
MAGRLYATIGRSPDNDVVVDHPTVSNHHARLSWKGGSLFIEDLSSANGTFVDGQRVRAARARPGVELRIGELTLPWSHEGLRTLLKAGAGARTLVLPAAKQPTFVCGNCGHVGPLPAGPRPAHVTCPQCAATLETGTKPAAGRGIGPHAAWLVAGVAIALSLVGYAGYRRLRSAQVTAAAPGSSARLPGPDVQLGALRLGGETGQKLAKALSPMDPVTRNAAVKLAARTEGPFHVEQVAEIWAAVRKEWRYVNDPQGREYFASATESIQNGYIGDCDDFAVTLASMVIAIGGKARVVLMDGPQGGHAYAEACVEGEPSKVASALLKHYKNKFRRYLSGSIPKAISYRSSSVCPIWLNLDWSASVPGGPYESEKWAVAVYENGESEELVPANAADAGVSNPGPAAGAAR